MTSHTNFISPNSGFPFQLLPKELCLEIFHFLPLSTLNSSALVCKEWQGLSKDPRFFVLKLRAIKPLIFSLENDYQRTRALFEWAKVEGTNQFQDVIKMAESLEDLEKKEELLVEGGKAALAAGQLILAKESTLLITVEFQKVSLSIDISLAEGKKDLQAFKAAARQIMEVDEKVKLLVNIALLEGRHDFTEIKKEASVIPNLALRTIALINIGQTERKGDFEDAKRALHQVKDPFQRVRLLLALVEAEKSFDLELLKKEAQPIRSPFLKYQCLLEIEKASGKRHFTTLKNEVSQLEESDEKMRLLIEISFEEDLKDFKVMKEWAFNIQERVQKDNYLLKIVQAEILEGLLKEAGQTITQMSDPYQKLLAQISLIKALRNGSQERRAPSSAL